MEEQWAPVAGFEGLYEISDQGRLRSRRGIRVLLTNPNGYKRVGLSKGGVSFGRKIHRLVAIAFVPGTAPGLDVCHIDGDKLNNRATNLRWGTRSENIQDQVRMGRHRNSRKTHCTHGHKFTPDNTRVDPDHGGRSCRTCTRQRSAAWRARLRELNSRV